ncbi:hypothetical protein GIB67_011009 [Kingdonia uniflora]|uniref:Pentatricopeptide repeat-containing protein n=1 Tax=Kingdonia uniflora TaxID=39325 RepID=A0A7J7L6J6_9MAGN|nr:hypothetical protein GIB67_011009 [Kingdonia uniflora]
MMIDALQRWEDRKGTNSIEVESTRSASPDVVTYNSLIYSLCNQANGKEAAKGISEMIGRGDLPNIHPFSILIDAMPRKAWLKRHMSV